MKFKFKSVIFYVFIVVIIGCIGFYISNYLKNSDKKSLPQQIKTQPEKIKSGVEIERELDGKIKSRTTYVDGKTVNIKWYKNGLLKKEEYFDKDKLIREIFYYRNGLVDSDRRYRNDLIQNIIFNDKNGKKNSLVVYKNGRMYAKKWFFENGQTEFEKYYEKGKLILENSFYENGDLHWEIGYKSDGNILFKKIYKHDKILDMEITYENGEEKIIRHNMDLRIDDKKQEDYSEKNENKEAVDNMLKDIPVY